MISATPPTSKGQLRYKAILEAATRLFIKHGYTSTTLDMIIREAGGSRRNISQLFGGKKGLFAAVLQNCQASLLPAGPQTTAESQGLEEALTAIGERFLGGLLEPERIWLFRMLVSETFQFPELYQEYLASGPQKSQKLLVAFLTQYEKKGRLKLEDKEIQAAQFIETLKGPLHLRAVFNPDYTPTPAVVKRHVEIAVRTFLHGVAVSPD